MGQALFRRMHKGKRSGAWIMRYRTAEGLVVLFINTLTYIVVEFAMDIRYAGVAKETLPCREKAHIALF